MPEPNKAVFLSYASQDAGAAQSICQALRVGGIEVWFDRSELRGGDAWDQKIRREIRECALFMPVISANTQARHEGYFRLEWRLADQRTHLMGKNRAFLMPICIDETRDTDADVPDSFAAVQWTRLPQGRTTAAFVDRAKRLLAPEQSPSASPTGASAAAHPRIVAGAKSRARLVLALVLAVAAVVAAGYLAMNHRSVPKVAATQPAAPAAIQMPAKSIAVLPFVDMSEKKDQEYFSDGLSEELIDHLTHAADLKVIARTSSFQFKGKNEDARTIAAALGVANLLEGSVRTAGHTVRITAQLIRASDGADLWSQVYDREMSDIFKIQDEIAGTVVEALKATMSGAAPSAPEEQNLEAYDLLLKGDFLYARHHPGDWEQAKEQYLRALQVDPNYALAWAKLGRIYVRFSGDESKARDALQRALAIDPNLAAAHRWTGRIFMNLHWDWRSAQSEFERASALDPNGPEGRNAHGDLVGMLALTTGQFAEVIPLVSKRLAQDPLDLNELWFGGWMQYFGGHLADAAVLQRRVLELDPAFGGAHGELSLTLLQMGQTAGALSEAQQEENEEDRLRSLALANWSLGRRADADAALGQLESRYADSSSYEIAGVRAYRGEVDSAMKWLERAYTVRASGMLFLKVDPLLRHLQGDSRYKALLGKMNMSL
jgi:TolB-like protein/Tfp pilus assembly protein PilF